MMSNLNLISQNIQEVLSESFLEYAGYNIQRRAIPDVRDGLKWGARQLLYSQMLGGFTYDKPFKKAIKSVSQAMGFCYVHGDASAYGTFIRMAKPFSYRYPLQEANGNYGTLINPEDHSASRYVELRGSKIAAQVLNDIKSKLLNTKQLMQTNVEETIKYIDEQLKSDRPAEDKKLDIEDFLIDVRL